MSSAVPFICLLAVTLCDVISGCSVPQGWQSMAVPQRLEKASLVILGHFRNMTHHPRPQGMLIDVAIHTDVLCILKNENNVQLDSSIVIWDETAEDRGALGGMCINNLYNIVLNSDVITMLHDRNFGDDDATKWRFENINVQSAYAYANETDLDLEEVVKATKPTGPCKQLGVTDTSGSLKSQGKATVVSDVITIIALSIGLYILH